ncbi:MAG: site-specific DNA-methyltransferase [Candidatus Stahlbacteria bacterium]|nr:site-specific DNA-methyltransferase [Candidatus Stahlbacteria bacterium]
MPEERIRKKDSARLVWDTKPRRAPNPKDVEFQTAEVVIPNPHRDYAQLPLSFRDGLLGEKEIDKQKMNRLIWGDNLLAMQALLAQGYEGRINLIYIDPPFDSKADYSHKMTIEGNEFTKEPSVIERLAYKDTWTGGTDSYLDMLYPRLQLMKRLLSEDGSIYVHLGWHVGHYVKVIMDEIFGKTLEKGYWHALDAPGQGDPRIFFGRTLNPPPGRHWMWDQEKIDKAIEERRLKLHPKTGKPEYWVEPEREQFADSNWAEIQAYTFKYGFDTEKSEKLLERIINASSQENNLIADFFLGSGTTLAVAEKLGRRWLGCELGKVGIQVTRARLVEMQAKPFLIENIGNYQREMIYLTGGRIWEMQVLILKLYGATPRDKTSGLGVRKAEDGIDELVYVGYPDRPITARKAEDSRLGLRI